MGLRDVGWASEWVSVFLDILYHLKRTKTAFMISSSRRPIHPFLNKKSVSWKADQRASIFKFWDWRNLFAFLTSLYWWAKSFERERAKEATEKHGYLIMKARKKRPDLTGQHTRTSAYVHHPSTHTSRLSAPCHPETVSPMILFAFGKCTGSRK